MKYIIFFLLLLFYKDSYSQKGWERTEINIPENESIYGNTLLPDGSVLILTHELLYKFNSDLSEAIELPIPTLVNSDYWFYHYNDVLILQHLGRKDIQNTFYSLDYGNSWLERDTLKKAFIYNSKLSVALRNNKNSFIFYTSADLGLNWKESFEFKYPEDLEKEEIYEARILFINDNTWLLELIKKENKLIGMHYKTVSKKIFLYKTFNKGKDWINITPPIEFKDFGSISFLDSLNGYGTFEIKTDDKKPDERTYNLLKTTDGGKHWKIILNVRSWTVNFSFINPNFGWISYQNQVCKTTDGGNSFVYQYIDFGKDYNFEILPISKDTCILIDESSDNNIFITTTGGAEVNDSLKKVLTLTKKKYEEEMIIEKKKREEEMSNHLENKRVINDKKYIANNNYASGNYIFALELYDELIVLTDSNDYDILFITAVCNYNIKRYSEALKLYEKALELNPESSSSYNNIGAIYEKQGNYEKAQEYYEKAYEIEPEDLYSNNIKNIKKLSYKLSSDDYNIISKYFPSLKSGSKLIYWQINNSASYVEYNYLENNDHSYANVLINYFTNYSAYQVNEICLKENGSYVTNNNKLIYNGYNKMVGEYSITKIVFPLDNNNTWSVLGFQLGFLGYEDRIITNAGTFYNCLVIGKDYYKEYYAPDIGLVLVRSAISQPYFITDKELIDYSIVK